MDSTSPAPGALAAMWMGATAATGLLLLLFGGRLLLMMSTLGGGTLGWIAGGAACESLVPEWSPALCAATCAVLCAGLAALFLRPAIALLLAVAGAGAGLLIAGALIERGMVPTGRAPYGAPRAAAVEPSAATGVRDARSSALSAIERVLSGQSVATTTRASAAGDQSTESPGGTASGDGAGALVTLARAGMRLGRELSASWSTVPPQARTLLAASAGAGGVAGLVLGLLFSRSATSGVSALIGAMLLCAAGIPLAERITGGTVRAPETPTGWLLLACALTAAGWAFQSWRRRAALASARESPSA